MFFVDMVLKLVKGIQIKFSFIMFFALLLSACASTSSYHSVAEQITEADFKESSGFLKKWIRVDGEALENRTAQIDLESCVNKFSKSVYYQGDSTTKTAKIFDCMYNFGWRIHVEEIWVTD